MDSPLSDIKIGHVTSQWAENNHLFVTYKSSMGSTNALAKEEAFEENLLQEALALYLTDHQTAGRGRNKNTWIDDTLGSALLSSWSYLLAVKPQPTTTCLVGMAVYRACSATWPFLPWALKAPNDIYIHDKKVAGILLETLLQGDEARLIIGLGLNVTSSPENVDTATSIVQSLPKGLPLLGQDWMAFLDRLLLELTDAISRSEEKLTSTDCLSLLTALNKHVLLKEKYTGMDSDGSLYQGDKKINWTEL
jgi:BirA family biotin operon repressor/biotin-[acetyl-CoA-carboxylase] ligase